MNFKIIIVAGMIATSCATGDICSLKVTDIEQYEMNKRFKKCSIIDKTRRRYIRENKFVLQKRKYVNYDLTITYSEKKLVELYEKARGEFRTGVCMYVDGVVKPSTKDLEILNK